MKVLDKERIAAVTLIDARLSEDEIAVYEAALGYVLDSLGAEEIERRFGASTDEIEGMRDDLRDALAAKDEADDERLVTQAE
jgi:hypothetical protein